MFRSTIRRFARERIGPHVREMDEAGVFRKDLLQEMFELGLMGIEIPEEFGGQGGNFFQCVLAVEALAEVDPSAAVIVDVQNTIANNILIRWGNQEQKRHYLPKLARDTVASFALSEAGSGSDAFALATRATRQGDHYLLTGRKLWITNAGEAGVYFVFANANPEAGHRGITCFLVERGFPGFQVGKKEDKLGIRASSTCELIMDDCRVPAANVLGEVGQGLQDRHRNSERRAHRHRLRRWPDWPRERSITPSPMPNSGSNSASPSPIFKECSSSWRRWPPKSKRRA